MIKIIVSIILIASIAACKRSPEEPVSPASQAGGPAKPMDQSQKQAPLSPSPERKLVQPLKHGEKIPDATLINQDGCEIKLSNYRGKVLVLTFIYTRCNLPTMCPMVTAKFKEVQDELSRQKIEGVHLLIVSFDTEHDKPEVLKEFAKRYMAGLSTWEFASGKPEEVGPLARAFNIYYRQDQPGIFDHNIIVAVVDKEGVFRDDFFGTEWKVDELVTVIKSLKGD